MELTPGRHHHFDRIALAVPHNRLTHRRGVGNFAFERIDFTRGNKGINGFFAGIDVLNFYAIPNVHS